MFKVRFLSTFKNFRAPRFEATDRRLAPLGINKHQEHSASHLYSILSRRLLICNVISSSTQVRRVLDTIRGRPYEEALVLMEYMPYKACESILKTLLSVSSAWGRADGGESVDGGVSSQFVVAGGAQHPACARRPELPPSQIASFTFLAEACMFFCIFAEHAGCSQMWAMYTLRRSARAHAQTHAHTHKHTHTNTHTQSLHARTSDAKHLGLYEPVSMAPDLCMLLQHRPNIGIN